MALPTKLHYWSGGAWVEEYRLIALEMIDEANHPFTITATISDPKNTRNNIYVMGMPIKLTEPVSGGIVWQGTVQHAETMSSPDGQVVVVTGLDDLGELADTVLNADFSPLTDMTAVISAIVAASSYHEVGFAGIVGSLHPGLWLKGQTTNVKAQVGYNYGAKVSVRNLEASTTNTDFSVGEVVKEYLTEDCSKASEAVHNLLLGPTSFTVTTTGTSKIVPSVEALLQPTGIPEGPNMLGSGQPGFDFLNDCLEFTVPAGGARNGCVVQGVRKDDSSSYAYVFHRDRYTGINASTLAEYNGGSDPAVPETFGLTIDYGVSAAGDQVVKMLGDYQFGYTNPKEVATRVVLHYSGTDQRGMETVATNSAIEAALGRSREHHVYAYWLYDQNLAIDIAGHIAAQLNNASGVLRGSCSISRWPVFTISGTKYFVRAGHTVHIHHALISSVNNKSMIVRKITYREPECVALLEFIDNQYGFIGSYPLHFADQLRQGKYAQAKQRFQNLATAGLANDRIPPSDPVALVAAQISGGVSLTWTYGYENDLSYYRVFRDTAVDMLTKIEIGKVHGDSFIDIGLNSGAKYTDYYYAVAAVDFARNESGLSNVTPAIKYGDTDIEKIFPIGSLYISTTITDPAAQLGFGTWAVFGAGKVMVGYDVGDADFKPVEATGGAKTHKLSAAEMPSHTHDMQNHTHGVGSYAIGNESSHTHGTGSYAVGNESSHTHSVSGATGGETGHTHSAVTTGGTGAADANGNRYFATSGNTGGSSGHTHNISFTSGAGSSHSHGFSGTSGTGSAHSHGISGSSGTPSNNTTTGAGGGSAHNNLQPYIVVYMFKRTA